MAGKGQEMTPVVHKFMHKITGDEGKRALLGADEIDRNQRQNAGEEEPGDNFPEGYWNGPCCRRLCEALHVLPTAKMPGSLSRDSDTVGAAAPAVNTAKTGPRQRDVARLEEMPGVCLIRRAIRRPLPADGLTAWRSLPYWELRDCGDPTPTQKFHPGSALNAACGPQ